MERNSPKGLVATLLLANNFALATNHGIADQQQIPLGSSSSSLGIPYVFRDAVPSDLNDITTVVLDAFAPAPHTRYVYQFRDQYPEYHRECMWKAIGSELFQIGRNEFIAKVIAIDDPGRGASRVVSVGVWSVYTPEDTRVARTSTLFGNLFRLSLPLEERAPSTLAIGGDQNSGFHCSAHLDINMTRALDVQMKVNDARMYLDKMYGRYPYLHLLATHPNFDGNGFGAAQCEWGMELAREMTQNVTLIATPAGFPLYRSLGFRDVKNVTIEMFDGLGMLWYEAMSYDPLVE